MNPFTDEKRTSQLQLSIDGLCDQLRTPDSLHRLVMIEKPATESAGDFALKSMLNAAIINRMVRGDYRGIQRLLVSLFGADPTVVSKTDERQKGARP